MPPSFPSITTDEEVRRELRRLQTLTALPEPVHLVGDTTDLIAPAFTGAWVNFDNTATTPGYGANRDAGFYKDRGRVYLTGVIKTGASGTSAFTLPVGYRPKAGTNLLVTAGATDLPAVVQVAAAGTVTPVNVGGSAVATYCFLDQSFLAA